MSSSGRKLEILYLLNSTVLITHEIDSAYWHEWTLLYLPGGIQFFLILHLPLIMIVLYGYREVSHRGRYSRHASLILACVGLFAVLLHGIFIAMGDLAFTLPVSLMLLGAALLLSLGQLGAVLRGWRVWVNTGT